jgi:hypothetical protein
MRYNVGEKLYVVNFAFHGQEPEENALYQSPYLRGLMPRISQIRLNQLTVEEHHKVPYIHDPEQKLEHDGYILKDDSGQVFYNQYPSSHYGQFSDHMDYRFRMKDPDTDEAREAYVNDMELNDPLPHEYMLLEQFLKELRRGITAVFDVIAKYEVAGVEEMENYRPLRWQREYHAVLSELLTELNKAFRHAFEGHDYDLVLKPIDENDPGSMKFWEVEFKTV